MVSLVPGRAQSETEPFEISMGFCGLSSYQLQYNSALTIETTLSSSSPTASLSGKLFLARHSVVNSTTSPFASISYLFVTMFSLSRFLLLTFSLLVAFISQQLILSGDIETNPGPKLGGKN